MSHRSLRGHWIAIAALAVTIAIWQFRHVLHTAIELCGIGCLALAGIMAGCSLIPWLRGRPRPEIRGRLVSRRLFITGRLESEPAGRPTPLWMEPAGWQTAADGRLIEPMVQPADWSGSMSWSAGDYREPPVPVVETAPADPDPLWDDFAEGHVLTEE